ncbi:MAG: hypothetical protein CMF68_09950 [Magnetovibrio sp.]|uniref:DUF2855 family protein n=1 Tax=uncultured Haliea sp. TaxID=622616 RepID=UPI000C6912E2|nr:hypothetical protein [Magnetovibrio sp.]|tara:strand:- start:83850 stop:84935 length:1086 start_codon:yes stop_codon:yes gene_type:complete
MTVIVEFQVHRDNVRETRTQRHACAALDNDQLLVRIDQFALTSNNVSYAVAGDMIGYWQYYPAPAPWGIVPAWGSGTVIASAHPEIPEGERLWGFFPMASHTVLTAGRVRQDQLTDVAEHRQPLPALYNNFRRTAAEPAFLQAMESQRSLLFPLFSTAYVLFDYLQDNAWFGATQIVIGSASSKTAYGLAWLLRQSTAAPPVVGLTSPGNVAFTSALGCYDSVLTYGTEAQLNPLPSVWVDMSGNTGVTAAVHESLDSRLQASVSVGLTHWDAPARKGPLPGPRPEFFFAPAQIGKREKEWGPGVIMERATQASADIATATAEHTVIEHRHGTEALRDAWLELLDNRAPAQRGLLLSLAEP